MKKKKEVIESNSGTKYIVTFHLSDELTLLIDKKYMKKATERVKKFIEDDSTVLLFPFPVSIVKLDK